MLVTYLVFQLSFKPDISNADSPSSTEVVTRVLSVTSGSVHRNNAGLAYAAEEAMPIPVIKLRFAQTLINTWHALGCTVSRLAG